MPISETDSRQALRTLLKDIGWLTPDEHKQLSEASVVRQFLDRLLEEVLGWPIKDPLRDNITITTTLDQCSNIITKAEKFAVYTALPPFGWWGNLFTIYNGSHFIECSPDIRA